MNRSFAGRSSTPSSVVALLGLGLFGGCNAQPGAVVTQLTEARRLGADLRVQFNRASDASDRAVLADTDETSIAFAQEAGRIQGLVTADAQALRTLLQSLGYAAELAALDAFDGHGAAYAKVDHDILELAVENTNLKAQRLSFGPARQAADAVRDVLEQVGAATPAKDRCRVDALVAKAVVALREIQVLQAPHIAEADAAAMTRLEQQMAALSATARDSVQALSEAVAPKARDQVAAARAALERFEGVSGELVPVSRRNSNVRSLELSLRRKPALTAACDEDLRALEDALAKEAFSATR